MFDLSAPERFPMSSDDRKFINEHAGTDEGLRVDDLNPDVDRKSAEQVRGGLAAPTPPGPLIPIPYPNSTISTGGSSTTGAK